MLLDVTHWWFWSKLDSHLMKVNWLDYLKKCDPSHDTEFNITDLIMDAKSTHTIHSGKRTVNTEGKICRKHYTLSLLIRSYR